MPPKREKITATTIDENSKLEEKAYDAIVACPLLDTLYQRSRLFYAETYSKKPSFSKSAYDNCFLIQVGQKHKSKALEKRLQYAATEAILEISESFDNLTPMQKAMIIRVTEKLAIEQGFKGIYFEAVPQIHGNEAIRTDGKKSVTRTDCYSLAQSVLHASFTKDHISKPPVVSIPPNANAQSLLFHELSHAVDHLCTKHQSSKDVLNYIITNAQQSSVPITGSSLSVDGKLNMTPLISSAMLIADPTEVLLIEYTIITRKKEGVYEAEAPEFLSDIKVNKDALDKDGILLGSSTSMEFLTFSLENIFAFMAKDDFKKYYEIYINDGINACRDRLERIHAIGQKTEQNKIIGHAIGMVAASMYEYTKVIIEGHENEEFAKCLMTVPEILQDIRSKECSGTTFPAIATYQASSSSYDVQPNFSSSTDNPTVRGDVSSEEKSESTKPSKIIQKTDPDQSVSTLTQSITIGLEDKNIKKRKRDSSSEKSKLTATDSNLWLIGNFEPAFNKLDLMQYQPIMEVENSNSTVTEISSEDTLKLALDQCKSMEQDQHRIIVFKVHAGNGNFAEQQNENNHYVGLVIRKNSDDKYIITYIDPTGRQIHDSVAEIVKDKLEVSNTDKDGEISSSTMQLQTFEVNQDGVIINGTHCGPFLAYLISLSINNTELGNDQTKITDEEQSNSFGLALRSYYQDATVQLPELESYLNEHLRLATKSDLKQISKTPKPNLKQILEHHYQSRDSQEKLQLEELTETITLSEAKSIQDSKLLTPDNQQEQRSSTKPKIHLIPESDHKIDHPNHIKNLLAHIDSLPTPQEGKANNIIIALERKQEGKNLGMPDVILLAELIKKEEKLNQEKLDELPPISLIPDNVRNSLIYQDALLYKAAEEKGIKVIGIDKAKISAQKRPDQEGYDPKGYNEEREDHMIEMLVTISNSHPNYNIIFPVGASHVENISVALEARSLSVAIDSFSNQETVVKTSRFTDRLGTELDVTNAGLLALQQRMRKQSVSYEKPKKLEASTEENAKQENSGIQKSHVDKLTQKSTSEIPQPER